MKKTYQIPSIDIYEMKLTNSMLTGSVNSISTEEADKGTEDSPVNFGRGTDGDWDD